MPQCDQSAVCCPQLWANFERNPPALAQRKRDLVRHRNRTSTREHAPILVGVEKGFVRARESAGFCNDARTPHVILQDTEGAKMMPTRGSRGPASDKIEGGAFVDATLPTVCARRSMRRSGPLRREMKHGNSESKTARPRLLVRHAAIAGACGFDADAEELIAPRDW